MASFSPMSSALRPQRYQIVQKKFRKRKQASHLENFRRWLRKTSFWREMSKLQRLNRFVTPSIRL
jgi:hypothetical protein